MSMRDPTPSAPDAALRRGLLDSLRDLERDPAGAEKARRHLVGWLADPAEFPNGPHLEVHQLRELTSRRQREGADFLLPDHLLECKVCLDLFQVLCEENGKRAAAPSFAAGPISSRASAPPRRGAKRRRTVRVLALAGLLLLGLPIWIHLQPPGIILESGTLRQQSDILRGGRLPARIPLEALQRARLSLLDGSRIELEPGARIRVGKTLRFRAYVLLEEGQAHFDFRDPRSAPEVRAGELRVFPASAGYEIRSGPQGQRVTVQRGNLRMDHPARPPGLSEGETLDIAP